MRDPEGSLFFENSKVIRKLYAPVKQDSFLKNELAQILIAEKKLISYFFESEDSVVSPKIPFVTYPYEWCNSQLLDAAKLSLQISKKILPEGYELKDASAWNIIFDGCSPIFCDHLSFQKIKTQQWFCFAQFVRNFILPLVIANKVHVNVKNCFKLDRDGIQPDIARNILGYKGIISRYFPLLLRNKLKAAVKSTESKDLSNTYHKNIYSLCEWFLSGVDSYKTKNSIWVNYTNERSHYEEISSKEKLSIVSSWLTKTSPNWVVDLGCNTGEFSKLSAGFGAKVIAIDLDHASIEELYLSKPSGTIFPVLADLDDLSGGRGWMGEEFPGLMTRLKHKGDLVLMLAVIHHLAISSSIPYDKIAQIANHLTQKYLIVELLDHEDPLVEVLAAHRNRSILEFSLDKQKNAFYQFFNLVENIAISGTKRQLLLMEKK